MLDTAGFLREARWGMPTSSETSEPMSLADLSDALSGFFDASWYASRYPDVAASGNEPIHHFIRYGVVEGRDPNRFFDSAWYLTHYPDVANSGQHPLLHYIQMGAGELRNPHPRFDAAYYVDQHPEAADNPLRYHLLFGLARGWVTEKPIAIRDYLPSGDASPGHPCDLVVDVVIPAYRGLAQTRRCIETVLADPARPAGQVIVVDDRSPEPKLSAWLDRQAADGLITLVRNRRNRGFVASVNTGIEAAGTHDVVLLNSDTEVAPGWLARLAGHAYATPRVASVSPFSNNATICGYPRMEGGPPAFGLGVAELDAACQAANAGRSVELPTTVGFCMYVRRAALADIGMFDAEIVRPRLWRRERLLPARQHAGLAPPAGLRHLRLSRRLGQLRRQRIGRRAARHNRAARALSAICTAGGAAREAGCRGAVPLRDHNRAIPPRQPTGHPDADA